MYDHDKKDKPTPEYLSQSQDNVVEILNKEDPDHYMFQGFIDWMLWGNLVEEKGGYVYSLLLVRVPPKI